MDWNFQVSKSLRQSHASGICSHKTQTWNLSKTQRSRFDLSIINHWDSMRIRSFCKWKFRESKFILKHLQGHVLLACGSRFKDRYHFVWLNIYLRTSIKAIMSDTYDHQLMPIHWKEYGNTTNSKFSGFLWVEASNFVFCGF